MQYLILLPLVVSFYVAATRSVQAAFLNVYLPVLLLIPDYFNCNVPCFHRAAHNAIFGLALMLRPKFKFTLIDLLVGLFVIGEFISENLATGVSNAISLSLENLSDVALPYLCGKYVIEQGGLRSRTASRIVVILFAIAALSPYEFLTSRNPFYLAFYKVFEQYGGWEDNTRWGFWRIGATFGGAEIAGCIFLVAIVLQIWLYTSGELERQVKWLPFSRHAGLYLLLGLAAGSFMTISRGPWIGLVFALPIAFIGLTKNVVRSSLIVAVLGLVIGSYLYVVLDQYTNTSWETVENKDQQNAYYRRVLLDVYSGYIEQGGLWGWGQAARPSVKGMESIDNEFLLVQLISGKVGFVLFVSIAALSAGGLIRGALANRIVRRDDMRFQFTLLGILVGFCVSITTVYLGLQAKPIYFLIIGWAEGTKVFQGSLGSAPTNTPQSSKRFPYVFDHAIR